MTLSMNDSRYQALQRWVEQQMLSDAVQASSVGAWSVVSGDASFRRYFRCQVAWEDGSERSLIAVDAPAEHEDSRVFVHLAEVLHVGGVNVPSVFAADFEQGYMLLSDLGDTLLLSQLTDDTADDFYARALGDLLVLQQCNFESSLPAFDRDMLITEMQLFSEWFLKRHLQLDLPIAQLQVLHEAYEFIADQVLAQPQVPVHRDYHARNIMITDNGALGYIDFQDAVMGSITYDPVSLLRDAYIEWPVARIRDWALQHKAQQQACGQLSGISDEQWLQWFYMTAAQRHLKVAGIFARLNHRDGKSRYLSDIPLTLKYLMDAVSQLSGLLELPELAALEQLLRHHVLPEYERQLSETLVV